MKATFRLYALDHTHYWDLDEDHLMHGKRVWTVYLFREGEATYCCELTPSTALHFVENRFEFDSDTDDLRESMQEAADDLRYDEAGETVRYVRFIDTTYGTKYMSDPIEVETDEEDDEEARNDLLAKAMEEVHANYRSIEGVNA